MKKLLISFLFISLMLPVMAENVFSSDTESLSPTFQRSSLDMNKSSANPGFSSTESVRSFSRPYDPRFQYGLPDSGRFRYRSTKPASQYSTQDDDGVVELNPADIKPAKKIIKKMSAETTPAQNNFDNSGTPMNYDNFPKYYDPNDMSNQQFMPMMGF